MNRKTSHIPWFFLFNALLLLSSGLCAGTFDIAEGRKHKEEHKEHPEGHTADGPYILYQPDGKTRIIRVTPEGNIQDTVWTALPESFRFKVTDHNGEYPFEVKLHAIQRPDHHHPQPQKTFVLSDPHGRLDCLISLLQGNNVIDEQFRWVFGANHLVVIGDVFDRGKDVIAICWLLYKLEAEAAHAGGKVSFLLGNHETMILGNNLRYAKSMYPMLADRLDMEYSDLLGPDTELGRWLATRNTLEIIGKDLYVHAGLSGLFYRQQLDIPTVNELMSRAIFLPSKERKNISPQMAVLYGNQGPIWYRGMVRKDAKYHPLSADTLQLLLDKYHCNHIFVGHTIFRDISTFYKRKVIGVNVRNQYNMERGRGRGVLIENNRYYVAGDEGILRKLKVAR